MLSVILLAGGALHPHLMPTAARRRSLPPRLSMPDELSGVSMQRQLGELTFSEMESTSRSPEDVLRGSTSPTSLSAEQVNIGLYYGQLTSGSASGTRVLVKCFSSERNNALASARAAAKSGGGGGGGKSAEARMRERLEASLGGARGEDVPSGGSGGGDDDPVADPARRSLESLLSADGTSLAEALAENEYAAHCRVQARGGDLEKSGLLPMLGRLRPTFKPGEEALILHVFPWRGEQVRMALPTRLPHTLASWLLARSRGETDGAKMWDKSVPLRACQQRSKFVREALRGALVGLATLHGAGLLHQSLSPSAVLLSSDDDRKGEAVRATLTQLGFCRDAASLALAYRAGPDGDELPSFRDSSDPLDVGLLQRALKRSLGEDDADERARYGRAEDMREFGMLALQCFVLGNAPPASELTELKLRSLCDGAFAGRSGGSATDGVDVDGLRDYLDAEDGLRLGAVGGVDALDAADRSGWDLLKALLAAEWEERPTAEAALRHPFWSAPIAF